MRREVLQGLDVRKEKWARALPLSEASDEARLYIAGIAFGREKERQRAMEIYAQVSNKDAARGNLRRAAYWWLARDPAQARPWIESQALLTQEDKEWIFKSRK